MLAGFLLRSSFQNGYGWNQIKNRQLGRHIRHGLVESWNFVNRVGTRCYTLQRLCPDNNQILLLQAPKLLLDLLYPVWDFFFINIISNSLAWFVFFKKNLCLTNSMPSNQRDAKYCKTCVQKNSDNHSVMSPNITIFSLGLRMVKTRDKYLQISKTMHAWDLKKPITEDNLIPRIKTNVD
jgi:hypothetical protein